MREDIIPKEILIDEEPTELDIRRELSNINLNIAFAPEGSWERFQLVRFRNYLVYRILYSPDKPLQDLQKELQSILCPKLFCPTCGLEYNLDDSGPCPICGE
jgi:rubrerythrin